MKRWFIFSLSLILLFGGYLLFSYRQFSQNVVVAPTTSDVKAAGTHQKIVKQVDDADVTDLAKARLNQKYLNKTALDGWLKIDDVDIDLPIYGQLSQYTLSAGVAEYFPKRGLTSANTVLAAHNFGGADVLLADLNKVKPGMMILTTDYKKVYHYQVDTNQLVDESRVDLLDLPSSGKQLTLLRCEGPVGTNVRRVVTASLVDVSSYTPEKIKTTYQTFGEKQVTKLYAKQVPVGLIVIAGVIFVLIVVTKPKNKTH